MPQRGRQAVTRVPAPPNGRGSPHEIGKRNTNSVSNADQCVEQWALMALLDAVVRGAVQVGAKSDGFLSEFRAVAGGADALPDGPAAGQDPVGRGRGRWHSPTFAAP